MSDMKETPTAKERRQVWANAYALEFVSMREHESPTSMELAHTNAKGIANYCLRAFDEKFGRE